jgi:hypothetical protein
MAALGIFAIYLVTTLILYFIYVVFSSDIFLYIIVGGVVIFTSYTVVCKIHQGIRLLIDRVS